ncbi:MAG: N-methyl-L-tryptophan oxidase [Verrucomicrobiales bacterium]|nr:N-methyl-L-tryptophan oxidase [Verrucomicrobiales bacterium]
MAGPRSFEVIVLGTGGMGSAAAYHLAKNGHRVLGLDRFPGGHNRGSSHGETRIIRKAYFEHPDYVPLLQRAYGLWSDLESETGQQLYFETGLIEIGPPDGIVVPGVIRAAKQHGLPLEKIERTDFPNRFPSMRLPENHLAVFEKEAGFLRVEDCVRAHLDLAQRHGAEFEFDAAVTGWSADESGVTVKTEKGEEFRGDALIVTTGAWSAPMMAELGMPLRIVRAHLHWFECGQQNSMEAGCPCFFYETENSGGAFYGFPAIDDLGLKVAEHDGRTEIFHDPLEDPDTPESEDSARVRDFVDAHFSDVHTNRRTRHVRCFYSQSPDGHFIIDRHPEHGNVVFGAGFSGHGFKFASVVGEHLANLAVQAETNPSFDFLGLRRNAGQF